MFPIKIANLLFGTAGIPLSTKGNTIQGIKDVSRLKLDAMELEFVRSINIKKEKALEVNEISKKSNVILTCHAPYFINLNSNEKPKYYASISRILSSARIANLCGAYSVCFHPGFYMKEDQKKVYNKIKKAIKDISKTLNEENNKIWLRPETTGKNSQFGSFDELVEMSSDIDNVLPCIDFAHLHARSNGKYNTKEEFHNILERIEKDLGKIALNNMHVHISGIAYTEKGEKNHLNLKDSDFNFKDLLKTWKEFNIRGVVICESPNIEKDALLLKKEYSALG